MQVAPVPISKTCIFFFILESSNKSEIASIYIKRPGIGGHKFVSGKSQYLILKFDNSSALLSAFTAFGLAKSIVK
ncbi:hypothetical protein GCM10022271_20040 [Corallibacter vietnamensis]|uniref:Uncharacterized protein n=1 Tax=Corallibacter vietnamensis TaxID=904130 RepID=A0ABP7HD33_9FLAO